MKALVWFFYKKANLFRSWDQILTKFEQLFIYDKNYYEISLKFSWNIIDISLLCRAIGYMRPLSIWSMYIAWRNRKKSQKKNITI